MCDIFHWKIICSCARSCIFHCTCIKTTKHYHLYHQTKHTHTLSLYHHHHPQICAWFAERSDLILLLFDAHKLDISDEFTQTVEKLKGHEDKIRCILNKADQIDRQRLMRVYGALMWGMGKVMRTPEVSALYCLYCQVECLNV
jgi:hypothetical protein